MSERRVLADGAEELANMAARVLRAVNSRNWSVATAESCTGGLMASLLTDIQGLSNCFERGFVCYSVEAKTEMLGIERIEIERHGAVSREIALAMAKGALANSHADVSAAITGFAGPAGKHDEAGLVHIAVQIRDRAALHRECHFGDAGRERTRQLAVQGALEMIEAAAGPAPA
jgi:nicotinamide-nucleotide amidase